MIDGRGKVEGKLDVRREMGDWLTGVLHRAVDQSWMSMWGTFGDGVGRG